MAESEKERSQAAEKGHGDKPAEKKDEHGKAEEHRAADGEFEKK